MEDAPNRERDDSPPPRGRPRDPALTDRLLTGALDLVADHGLDHFNAHALATATGAGKAAVYRRWPNMDALLADAVRRCRPVPTAPDTGSLRGDLVALLEPCTRELGRDERALAAVLGHARHSPRLRAGLEAAMVAPLHAAVTTVARHHAARGHNMTTTQQALVRWVVPALWWGRYVGDPATHTDTEVQALVDCVLAVVASGSSPSRPHWPQPTP